MEIKDTLKEIRKALGLNQTAFGEKIGAKQTTVAGWENGIRKPSEAIKLSICREFNINESFLNTGEEPMFRPAKTIDNELTIEIVKLIGSDDEFTKQCVLQYLKLSDESKAMFKDFLVSVVDGCRKDGECGASNEWTFKRIEKKA